MIDLLLEPKFRAAAITLELITAIFWQVFDWSFGAYLIICLGANLAASLILSIIQTNKTIKYNIKNNALDVANKLLNEENASKIRFRNYNR